MDAPTRGELIAVARYLIACEEPPVPGEDEAQHLERGRAAMAPFGGLKFDAYDAATAAVCRAYLAAIGELP